jgi:hypothetical protein
MLVILFSLLAVGVLDSAGDCGYKSPSAGGVWRIVEQDTVSSEWFSSMNMKSLGVWGKFNEGAGTMSIDVLVKYKPNTSVPDSWQQEALTYDRLWEALSVSDSIYFKKYILYIPNTQIQLVVIGNATNDSAVAGSLFICPDYNR